MALILGGLTAALVWQARVTGVTVDEPSHLLSAHLYWQGADRLKPGDLPPLIKLLVGWIPGFFHPPIPYGDPVWKTQEEWLIALEMMARLRGSEIQRLFFFSRLPLLIFPLLTALLLWRWGRWLFGARVGVCMALLYVLEPTALAHGALVKNDLAATFGHLLFWFRVWRFWREPTPFHLVCLGAALLLATLSKLSMLVLLPQAVGLVLLRYITLPGRRVRNAVAAAGLMLTALYLGLLAAYQFQVERLSAAELASHRADPALPRPLLWAAQVFRVVPIPRQMWAGVVSLLQSNAAENMIYLLGDIYPNGHPLYFVIALAFKVPVAIQILALCGVVMVVARLKRRQGEISDVFWLLPGTLYVGLASLSSLQLGVRLVLPALPFGLLLCGLPVAAWIRGRKIAIVAALLTWLGMESARIYPHGISYFNLWAGGPDRGLHFLADSNLDWGQDLRELERLVRRCGIPKIRLSYFGTDNPYGYFREEQIEMLAPPWAPEYAKGAIYRPEPGFYAISANLIPGHMFAPEYRDYYRAFRSLEPVAKAGYSIYVYYVR